MSNDATVKFGYDGTALNRGLADQERRLSASAKRAESSFSRMRGAIAGIGLGYLARESVRTVASLDRLRRGMTTLEGSVEAGEKRIAELVEVSKLPGLDFEQAVQGDIRLRSVGLSAELSKKALIEMGNAISNAGGTSVALDNVTLAMTQLVSRGKVTADNINQIANAVPQLRAVMKDVFGTADSEALQKMDMTAEEFIERLITGFEKLDRATAGLDEQMQDFTISIKLATEAFAEGLVRQGVDGASQLGNALTDNIDLVRQLGTATADVFSAAGRAAVAADEMIVSAISHLGLMLDGQSLSQANAAIMAVEQQRLDDKAAAAAEKKITNVNREASATVVAEEKKQKAIKQTTTLKEMESKRNVTMGSLAELELRARGKNKQADKLERARRIDEDTARIRKETGASEEQAREIAERRANATDKIAARESGKRSHIGGVRRKSYMESGIDQFNRNQQKHESSMDDPARPGYERGGYVPTYDAFSRSPQTSAQRTGRMMGGHSQGPLSGRAASTTRNSDLSRATAAPKSDDIGSKLDKTNALLERVFFSAS